MLTKDSPLVIHTLQTVDSTSLWARRHLLSLDPHALHMIRAREQSKAQGSRGRPWVCGRGDLMISFVFFREEVPLERLAQFFSFLLAITIEQWNLFLRIKWPNDLLISGQKCGGILTENIPSTKGSAIILGCGLNLSSSGERLEKQLTQRTGGPSPQKIASLLGENISLESLETAFSDTVQKSLPLFCEQAFTPWEEAFQKRLAFVQKRVLILNKGKEYRGLFLGIDTHGHALLKEENGQITSFAQASLRVLE